MHRPVNVPVANRYVSAVSGQHEVSDSDGGGFLDHSLDHRGVILRVGEDSPEPGDGVHNGRHTGPVLVIN